MKRRSHTAGARRRTARGAAVVTAVLLGGMIPGAQAAAGAQVIDVDLAYLCDFPSGEQPVKVGVSAGIPGSAEAGQVLQPTDVVTELTLPEAALAGLTGSGTATVSAETRLTTDVTQNDRRATAEWIGTTEKPVLIPGTGDLTLSTSGGVPYVRPGASGELSLAAGGLAVTLTPRTVDGAPAEPRTVSLACVPEEDQETALAKLTVSGEDEETPAEPSPTADRADGGEKAQDPEAPEVGARAEPPARADAPPCVGDPDDGLNMVAYVTGYANVTKLDGATKFPVACSQITQGETRPDFSQPGFLHIYQDSAVVMQYTGKPQLPPASSTFLTFGFMPTTATLEMTQIPPEVKPDGIQVPNIKSDIAIDLSDGSSRNVTLITMDFMLRLRDVEVNGVPLDVGNDCRTSRPFTLSLKGTMTRTPEGVIDGYTLVSGGALTGSVTLPPFSGCGADEDLDNLFTASLSGVPGYVKQIQGAPCATVSADPAYCTPDGQPVDVPTAER